MLTVDQVKKDRLVGDNVAAAQEFYCLATDARPADAPNGSRLYELDSSGNTLTLAMFFTGEGWVDVFTFNLS